MIYLANLRRSVVPSNARHQRRARAIEFKRPAYLRVRCMPMLGTAACLLRAREVQLVGKELEHARLEALSDFITVVSAFVNLEGVRDLPIRKRLRER
jgi:hypothetical protein